MGVLTVFLGIDPGKHGGIAAVDEWGGMLFCAPMPVRKDGALNTVKIKETLKFCTDDVVHGLVILEKAQAMPKQGVTSMFTYGVGYGKLLAVLEVLALPYEEVRPHVWKKEYRLQKQGKAASCDLAAELFEDFVPHRARGGLRDGEAEALLLAEWGRRNRTGGSDA